MQRQAISRFEHPDCVEHFINSLLAQNCQLKACDSFASTSIADNQALNDFAVACCDDFGLFIISPESPIESVVWFEMVFKVKHPVFKPVKLDSAPDLDNIVPVAYHCFFD